MKYFFSSLAGLFAVLFLSNPAWAEMKENKGFELVGGVFAEQFNQTSGNPAVTATVTDVAGHGGLFYSFGTLYVGGTYFNFNQSTTGSGATKNQFINWYGPTAGVAIGNVRITGTYVLSPDSNQLNLGQTLTNGTGFAGTIAYTFYVAPKVFIAPLIDYFSVTYSQPAGSGNFTLAQLAPFLALGINF